MKIARSLASLCLAIFGLASFVVSPSPVRAAGASFSFSPAQGQYIVDSTFEVSILVNTNNNSINAVEAYINFPADKLQVVNPTVSKSFISIWIAGPSYSNTEGKISFQGGLPSPGITTSAGVVSTVQFRAKASGTATLSFGENSKILANDGNGTNILTSKSVASYDIKLAPPGGPVVSSPTHDDQNKWYANKNVTMNWSGPDGATAYSYVFDDNPSTVPPDQVSTSDHTLGKTIGGDGQWYFHIKAKNKESWGGTTNYSLKIDATAPATFSPKLDRTTVSADNRGIATFTTTDATSGLNHYEVKVIDAQSGDTTGFFTEQQSPYQLPTLAVGKYKLVVRAIDNAGNQTDGLTDFSSGSAGAFNQRALFSNPLVNNIIISFLFLILAIIGLIFWRRRSRQRRMLGIYNDLQMLKQTVVQKQMELQQLLGLEVQSRQQMRSLAQPQEPLPTVQPLAQNLQPGQMSPAQEFQAGSAASGNETHPVGQA